MVVGVLHSEQLRRGTMGDTRIGDDSTDTRAGEITVQAFVRPTILVDPVDEKIARLTKLDDEDDIDALLVRAWPGEVPLSSERGDVEAVEIYERFKSWADRLNATVELPFDVETRHSEITGESCEVLTTPVLCFGVYVDSSLKAVYPYRDEHGYHTAKDGIDALAAGQFGPAAGKSRSTRASSCPGCGAGLVNVQGLAACRDCSWVATVRSGGSEPSLRRRIH